MAKPKVMLFDVNETLSDLSPMADRFTAVGAPTELAKAWFASTLRDGFAVTVAGRMASFADIASHAARTIFGGLDLDTSVDDAVDTVMAGFLELDVHEDVRRGVPMLAESGIRLVTLSNGSAQVAEGLLERAGIRSHFEQLLSVEEAGIWKPAEPAYSFALGACEVEASEAMLVAVHPWDIDGASRAGLATAWIDRAGGPYPEHFATPTVTVPSFDELAERLA